MILDRLRKRGSRAWLTPRAQYLGALLFAVALPYLGKALEQPSGRIDPQALNAALASFIAITIGALLHRRISALPGTQRTAALLPTVTFAFGLVIAAILLLRIDYSRATVILAYFLSLAWFYLIAMMNQFNEKLILGLVAGGSTAALAELPGLTIIPLALGDWPTGLNAVAADLHHDHSDAWEARLADYALAGVPVYHSKELFESLTGRADLERLSENNLGGLGTLAAFSEAKSLIDRLLAVPVLLALLPLLGLTVLAIKLDSPGPALFRQARIGRGGKLFDVIKFRTMTVTNEHAEASREDFITREDDVRITRLGRILRRTRIDELPQIVNILRGEMSWIGPRPEAAALSEWYEQKIPFYRYRHVVTPGITGWAQVNQGHVTGIDDIRLKLQFDFFYIRNFSVWLDLMILAKTVRTVVTGFGHK